MRRRAMAVILEIYLPFAGLTVWWIWSSTTESFYFPPLPKILATFADTWVFERIGSDLAPSIARLGAGYTLAVIIGVSGGIILGMSGGARLATGPILEFVRAIPAAALIPFAMLVFGIGDQMKVALIGFACTWPILLNARDGVAGIDTVTLETARVYRVRGFARIRSVLLPAILPQIFAGMRTSLSLAVVLMVISEMVAATNGVGFFLLQSQRSFAIPEMWSAILLLGLLGYALNAVFMRVERRALRWHRSARASALGGS